MAIVYVNLDADGADNGSSWENAYNDLQDALENAEAEDEIWIAEGTYTPTESNNRNTSFELRNSVSIYGGFTGNETSLTDRNFRSNETILSGNIGDEDEADDNSYHVVRANNLSDETTLDGLTIRDGFNSDASDADFANLRNYGAGILATNTQLIVSNLNLTENQADFGGGIAILGENSEISLINNIITNNEAERAGGGVLISDTEVDLINNLFLANEAGATGGGLYLFRATGNVINNTFSTNFSEEQGGAITAENGSTLELSNSIVWGNTSEEQGEQIYNKQVQENFEDSTVDVSYTLVENGFDGDNNLDDNPQFIDPDNDNYRLESNSPAIDVGDNELVTLDIDLDGNTRVFNGIVDLGAYEFSLPINEIRGTDDDDSLRGSSDNDLILGLGGRDTLSGRGGNDTLDGDSGRDSLNGGSGNDSLLGGGGRDRLRGRGGDDTLNGGESDDNLQGGDGDDILIGRGGDDLLLGGSGNNRFDFINPDEGIDTIEDFDEGNDLIGISVDGFGGELEIGSLSSDQFVIGRRATESQHRFIFNSNQGNLFYDSDGSGDAERIQIATFSNDVSLDAGNFLLF
ncbi:choice-of-anchor Q domain-containing protein [Gloeocapsa sp. PCC 73106]|uniref:choice-of-anchor Q domain-containing protein n=1 Tax=Gloeocapsa sp. PCC 73106 TaxID=102232 RepID=UPI0002ABB516|nr:choice-of-anchor Q domain-containing protein [Gloeocapsa sp. PCC 73106]ELR98853.1 putative calcium-binding protein [Gloeocapsa sp. PCC 73106]